MQKSKLTVELSEELKTEFKIYCVINKISMQDVVGQLIREYLSAHQIKGEKGAM